LTVTLTDLVVGVALWPGGHDDEVRGHAAQHHKRRTRNRRSRYCDHDCRPVVAQVISGGHPILLLALPSLAPFRYTKPCNDCRMLLTTGWHARKIGGAFSWLRPARRARGSRARLGRFRLHEWTPVAYRRVSTLAAPHSSVSRKVSYGLRTQERNGGEAWPFP